MSIIKERCAEESDDFVDAIIEIAKKLSDPKFDFESSLWAKTARDIASRKARDLSKCIIKGAEPYEY